MIDIDDGDYVACICEGHSEITIMNLLLGDDSLCFKREKLLDGEVLSTRYYRDSNLFCNRYLTMDYEGGRVVVLVIQDRKGVKYSIKIRILKKLDSSRMRLLHQRSKCS